MLSEEQEKIKKLKKKLKIQEKKNAEIRDQMATQRTIFANERTLMAYLRTSITVIAGGLAAVKLSNDMYLELAGATLLPIGLLLAVYSFIRYRSKQKLIEGHHQNYSPTSHEHDKIHNQSSSSGNDRV